MTIRDASNTGCATLQRIDGNYVVTTANTVVEKVDIHGTLIIKAPGVRLRHFIARGGTPATQGQTACINITHPDAKDCVLEDFTITPKFPNSRLNGIYVNQPTTFRRADISGTVDGIVIYGDRVSVEVSWLHDLVRYPSTDHADGYTHNDCVQLQKGIGVRLVGNSMDGAYNAAVMVTQDAGPVADLLIADNYLDGGGATVNFGSEGLIKRNLVVANNRFGRNQRNPGMAIIRNPDKSQLTAFGNVWDDSGLPVSVTRGA